MPKPGTVPQIPPSAQSVKTNSVESPSKSKSKLHHLVESTNTFLVDVAKAWYMLLSVVVCPMWWAMLDAIFGHAVEEHSEHSLPETTRSASAEATKINNTFAERFKYIICTSFLLTSSLAISSYDQNTPQPTEIESATTQKEDSLASPSSSQDYHILTSTSSTNPKSTLYLTKNGKVLFNATFWAVIVLVPISKSRQAWIRSTVFLVSLVWGLIASLCIDRSEDLSFELSHRKTGLYSLLNHDRNAEAEAKSEYISPNQANKLKESICEQASGLVQACKDFDTESNKTIAAIQEVELVSRGFKLTHPLPPISRIEANATSPPRIRNGSWNSPATAMNGARLSRSSSSGASSASGWKHHGSRPQSILFSNGNVSPNGRSSPLEIETAEPIRMAPLRRTLIVSFEEAKRALHLAEEELASLVDEREMALLREMYELDESRDESMFHSVTPEPWTAPATTNSADKRSSWTSFTRARLDEEMSHPSGLDENIAVPGTPQRLSLLSDNATVGGVFSSNRKRDSGMSDGWSVASPSRDAIPSRGGSRLSYISDKTPSNTPNQNAATKRLSYVSSTSGANSPLQSKSFLFQQSSPAIASQPNRKRASLMSIGMMEDPRQGSNVSGTSKIDPYLIASLKLSFERIHSLRRRVLCLLLALDFTLKRKVAIKAKGGPSSMVAYWSSVGRSIKQLSKTMSSLATMVKTELEKDMGIGQSEEKAGRDQNGTNGTLLAPPSEQYSTDFTGLEDRLTAMGQALRSVQVKVRSCAEEMKMKSPPSLHGTPTRSPTPNEEPNSPLFSRNEKSEKILETVREDLLTLSAEWENALKIIRSQRCPTPNSAVGDTSSSTVNSSRLDSPQEAEEDALRQWVNARRGTDELSESEEERMASKMLESGVLQWTAKEANDGREGDGQADYSDLLLSNASPEHLPPPGLEKVYESIGGGLEAKMQRSRMSREERIRMAKELRAKADQAKSQPTPLEASTGIIKELEAVMKNRKPAVPNAKIGAGKGMVAPAGLDSPLHLGQLGQDESKFTKKNTYTHHNINEEEKQGPAAFAF